MSDTQTQPTHSQTAAAVATPQHNGHHPAGVHAAAQTEVVEGAPEVPQAAAQAPAQPLQFNFPGDFTQAPPGVPDAAAQPAPSAELPAPPPPPPEPEKAGFFGTVGNFLKEHKTEIGIAVGAFVAGAAGGSSRGGDKK